MFLPGERNHPGMPDGVCADALHGVDIACAASYLTDLAGEIRLSDEPASDAGIDGPESHLVSLLDQLHIVSEPYVDQESVGSIDLMLVYSDTTLLNAFPTNVVVYDEPLPRTDSGGSTITEVLVISHGEHSGGGARDPLEAALQDLTAPIPEDAGAEMLEADCHTEAPNRKNDDPPP